MKENIVYTSLDNFKLKNWIVESYTVLNEDFVEWVNENSIKLLINRNKAEMLAGEELKKHFNEVHEQVFFRLRGRSYFLDYYLPDYKIAVEIDGEYHKKRKDVDKQRDKDFLSIGIRTIRISAKDVRNGNFILSFKNAISHKTKTKTKKTKKIVTYKNESRLIKQAKKRLKEHDKMKHKAKWI
jgi:very-short-patch-repair endonuclease